MTPPPGERTVCTRTQINLLGIGRLEGGLLFWDPMQRTLRERIAHLERKIAGLQDELSKPGKSTEEITSLKIDLGLSERSLAMFQKACELEKRLKR